MDCPHCQKRIDDATLARYLASKGGKRSRRAITPEQQEKMQEARKAKKDKA